MYRGHPGFIGYVPWNLPLKLGGFMVHNSISTSNNLWHLNMLFKESVNMEN